MVSNVRRENHIKQKPRVKKEKVKPKLNKSVPKTPEKDDKTTPVEIPAELKIDKSEEKEPISIEELSEKYPVLKDKALVEKFLNVPLNNNQKGRIRQVLKDQLKDASDSVLPDVIYNKIVNIIKDSQNLTEPELRKLRILYNMLRTAAQTDKPVEKKKKKKNRKNKKRDKTGTENTPTKDKLENAEEIKEQKKEKADKEAQNKLNKLKHSKRYVVFVGNLPPNIDEATIKSHFKELADNIVSVRVPKLEEGRKSSIAYVELNSEVSYEMALSKHHSMLGPKRINVLYTMQKNSKVSKTEAKSKSAKLIALQKSGKLAGSVPMSRKRSHRRAKAKRAQAQAAKQ